MKTELLPEFVHVSSTEWAASSRCAHTATGDPGPDDSSESSGYLVGCFLLLLLLLLLPLGPAGLPLLLLFLLLLLLLLLVLVLLVLLLMMLAPVLLSKDSTSFFLPLSSPLCGCCCYVVPAAD